MSETNTLSHGDASNNGICKNDGVSVVTDFRDLVENCLILAASYALFVGLLYLTEILMPIGVDEMGVHLLYSVAYGFAGLTCAGLMGMIIVMKFAVIYNFAKIFYSCVLHAVKKCAKCD